MDTIDKILQLMESNGVSAATLTKEAGITNGLVTQWKSRKQQPSAKSIEKISKYFNVSLDWLAGNEQKNKPAAESDELNDLYDQLNRDNKQKILELARLYLAGQDKK